MSFPHVVHQYPIIQLYLQHLMALPSMAQKQLLRLTTDLPQKTQLLLMYVTLQQLLLHTVYPVKYFYVFSTDNSVVFAYEGKGKRDTKFRLCSRQSNAKAAHTSKYHIDNFSKMCGLRVKMTFSISAAGTCAPLFITVYGLNEREMPNSKCLLAPLRGMCIGGGGVNIGSNKKGVA